MQKITDILYIYRIPRLREVVWNLSNTRYI